MKSSTKALKKVCAKNEGIWTARRRCVCPSENSVNRKYVIRLMSRATGKKAYEEWSLDKSVNVATIGSGVKCICGMPNNKCVVLKNEHHEQRIYVGSSCIHYFPNVPSASLSTTDFGYKRDDGFVVDDDCIEYENDDEEDDLFDDDEEDDMDMSDDDDDMSDDDEEDDMSDDDDDDEEYDMSDDDDDDGEYESGNSNDKENIQQPSSIIRQNIEPSPALLALLMKPRIHASTSTIQFKKLKQNQKSKQSLFERAQTLKRICLLKRNMNSTPFRFNF